MLFAIGGDDGDDSRRIGKMVEVYSADTGVWKLAPPMPTK